MVKMDGILVLAYLYRAADGLRDPELNYGGRKGGIVSEHFPTLK